MRTATKGLVIRYFMGGFFLCDGKAPDGCDDNELYIGNTVKWFETWEEANQMREMINTVYHRGLTCSHSG
jgi:hypothetical protein